MLIYYVVYYTPSTYLSHNWKCVPFDCLHPNHTLPPLTSGCNHKSDFSMSLFVCF